MKSPYVFNRSGYHTVSVHDIENWHEMDYERARLCRTCPPRPVCAGETSSYHDKVSYIILK